MGNNTSFSSGPKPYGGIDVSTDLSTQASAFSNGTQHGAGIKFTFIVDKTLYDNEILNHPDLCRAIYDKHGVDTFNVQ